MFFATLYCIYYLATIDAVLNEKIAKLLHF